MSVCVCWIPSHFQTPLNDDLSSSWLFFQTLKSFSEKNCVFFLLLLLRDFFNLLGGSERAHSNSGLIIRLCHHHHHYYHYGRDPIVPRYLIPTTHTHTHHRLFCFLSAVFPSLFSLLLPGSFWFPPFLELLLDYYCVPTQCCCALGRHYYWI